ncbi:MAG: aminoacetone oxidase family FAD-binding enzyme, partial [Paracholeplasma sp.]
YQFAEALGHLMTPVFPALVKLNLDCPYLKETEGVKMETTVRLYQDNKIILEKSNDVLFTKYGVSGPTILDLSRKANELLLKQKRVFVSINLVPDYNQDQLTERFTRLKHLSVFESMKGLVHQKLIHPILKEANISEQVIVESLSKKSFEQLFNVLNDFRFEVISSKDFDEAQVTAGGVKLNQVDKITLESNLIPGLYFCGEVLDVDGLCGGYNLQWAWSSGYVAGMHAAS